MKKLLTILFLFLFPVFCFGQTRPDWTQIRGKPFVDVRNYGVKGDGTTDDTAAIRSAIAEAVTSEAAIVIPSGVYKITGSTPLEIDLGKISVIGLGDVALYFTTTGTAAAQIYSSLNYPAMESNTQNRIEGIKFYGDGTNAGVVFGHETYTNSGQINTKNCSFYRFDDFAIKFISNAWRMVFYNCLFKGKPSMLVDANRNAGESMGFYHCCFESGEIDISSKGFMCEFFSCSILNTSINVDGSSTILKFFGGNIENPGAGGSDYTRITLNGSTSVVELNNTNITFNNNVSHVLPAFVNNATSSVLVFNGVVFPAPIAYDTLTSTGYQTFCHGDGPVITRNCWLWLLSGARSVAIASSSSVLVYSGFEYSSPITIASDTKNWTAKIYGGTDATCTVDVTSKLHGSYGLQLAATGTTGVEVTQAVPCESGRAFQMVGNYKVQLANVPVPGYMQIKCYSKDGTQIGSVLSNALTKTSWTDAGWATRGITPPGTAYLLVILNVQPGGNTIYFDDIVLNLL